MISLPRSVDACSTLGRTRAHNLYIYSATHDCVNGRILVPLQRDGNTGRAEIGRAVNVRGAHHARLSINEQVVTAGDVPRRRNIIAILWTHTATLG